MLTFFVWRSWFSSSTYGVFWKLWVQRLQLWVQLFEQIRGRQFRSFDRQDLTMSFYTAGTGGAGPTIVAWQPGKGGSWGRSSTADILSKWSPIFYVIRGVIVVVLVDWTDDMFRHVFFFNVFDVVSKLLQMINPEHPIEGFKWQSCRPTAVLVLPQLLRCRWGQCDLFASRRAALELQGRGGRTKQSLGQSTSGGLALHGEQQNKTAVVFNQFPMFLMFWFFNSFSTVVVCFFFLAFFDMPSYWRAKGGLWARSGKAAGAPFGWAGGVHLPQVLGNSQCIWTSKSKGRHL